MILKIAEYVGQTTLSMCDQIGFFSLFLITTIKSLFTTQLRIKKLLVQMQHIGIDSLAIVVLTGAFSGAVLALQTYIGMKRFGIEGYIGPVVALSLTRELGPVLTALMVTGRAGSAITAEIGTMQITEQIEALKTLNINVNQYLIIPRMLASVLVLPLLALFSMFCGIVGGYVISNYSLGVNGEQYIKGVTTYLEISDIIGGLIKSGAFGLIFSWVGCYKGYYTTGGAKGVGISTTQSVVLSSILILISNYFLTALLFK